MTDEQKEVLKACYEMLFNCGSDLECTFIDYNESIEKETNIQHIENLKREHYNLNRVIERIESTINYIEK